MYVTSFLFPQRSSSYYTHNLCLFYPFIQKTFGKKCQLTCRLLRWFLYHRKLSLTLISGTPLPSDSWGLTVGVKEGFACHLVVSEHFVQWGLKKIPCMKLTRESRDGGVYSGAASLCLDTFGKTLGRSSFKSKVTLNRELIWQLSLKKFFLLWVLFLMLLLFFFYYVLVMFKSTFK